MTNPIATRGTITCSDLSFQWDDGTSVLQGLSTSIGSGRVGLIGTNGSGKSTLLRLLTGQLRPSSGSVSVGGRLAYLPQHVTLDTRLRVDQALGIAEQRAALRAVEAGEGSDQHFAIIGDDWDVEERAVATLGSLGLPDVELDRSVGALSGGETVLLSLATLLLERPDVLLLDEPTNNLDLAARYRLYQAVESWRSGLLVLVSHDCELLERVERIAELRSGSLTWYGGGWTAYQQAVADQRETASRLLRVAESEVRRQQRELEAAQIKLARRQRYDKKLSAQRRAPRIVAGERKRSAQESAGKLRGLQEDRLQAARDRREQAATAIRDDDEIRVDLPHTSVPAGRTVAVARGLRTRFGALRDGNLDVRGPERIALVGRNGSGKTSLLRTLVGELAPLAGEARTFVPVRVLPQRLDVLDDAVSVAANVARVASDATANEIRSQLARFLFRGARADQLAGTLSGGERFRAALAATMLATPAPQLLILDEPTNNLDLASVRQLTSALESFEGALLIASHDLPFLAAVGVTRWILVTEELKQVTADELGELLGPSASGGERG